MFPTRTSRVSWVRVAWYGAELGVATDFVYTLAFILYSIIHSTLSLIATPDIDAGWLGTAVTTWVALAIPAFLLAGIFTPIVIALGALTALAVNSVSPRFNPEHAPRKAAGIGVAVCVAVVLALCAFLFFGTGLIWRSAIAPTLIFWLILPLLLYIIAGGLGSWWLNRLNYE